MTRAIIPAGLVVPEAAIIRRTLNRLKVDPTEIILSNIRISDNPGCLRITKTRAALRHFDSKHQDPGGTTA